MAIAPFTAKRAELTGKVFRPRVLGLAQIVAIARPTEKIVTSVNSSHPVLDGQGSEESKARVTADTLVLFQDFDNVLHRCDAYRTRRGIVPGDPSATLFDFAQILDDLLKPYVDVRLVLSTSWVEVFGFARARDSLPLQSLRDRVIGATYHPEDSLAPVWSAIPRGQQVRRYAERHGLRRWLAIDDMREGLDGVESQLVHCQPGVGLGDKDVPALFAWKLEWMFGRRETSVVAVTSPSGRSK